MLFTPHFITAGVVGEYIGNPFLAFLVGVVIHFLLDSIPHYDTTDKGRMTVRQYALAIGDIIFCFSFVLFVLRVAPNENPSFWWGGLGGVLPDIFDVVPWWNKRFRRSWIGKQVHPFHERIQPPQPHWLPGLATQLVVLAIVLILHVVK
jgi:hypothetical protein